MRRALEARRASRRARAAEREALRAQAWGLPPATGAEVFREDDLRGALPKGRLLGKRLA